MVHARHHFCFGTPEAPGEDKSRSVLHRQPHRTISTARAILGGGSIVGETRVPTSQTGDQSAADGAECFAVACGAKVTCIFGTGGPRLQTSQHVRVNMQVVQAWSRVRRKCLVLTEGKRLTSWSSRKFLCSHLRSREAPTTRSTTVSCFCRRASRIMWLGMRFCNLPFCPDRTRSRILFLDSVRPSYPSPLLSPVRRTFGGAYWRS